MTEVRTEALQESQPKLIRLSADEAAALRQIGTELASRTSWWGESEGEDNREPTKVGVEEVSGGLHRVRVNDAVGVISTGNVQLVIRPKIPTPHLLYLLERSGRFPSLSSQRAVLDDAQNLWKLVAAWFIGATEQLLRLDLIRDYSEVQDQLLAARGQIQLLPTARLYYRGQLALDCLFEEFSADTPLNRLVREAVRLIAGNAILQSDLRRRAIRILARMEEVGDYRPHDWRATTDRRTAHYADAVLLARHVIGGTGRSIGSGAAPSWTFLVRTPEMVEAGILSVLQEALGTSRVYKRGRRLQNSTLTFNPDLVFDGGIAIGDVKYKRSDGAWPRADLYQIVAFAEEFGARDAALIRFRKPDVRRLSPLAVGTKTITEFTWSADDQVEPGVCAQMLADQVAAWANEVAARNGNVAVGETA